MKTINAAFSAPLERTRIKLNWRTIGVQRHSLCPRGWETLGGSAGAETWMAISCLILGLIRRVYTSSAQVTRPLRSGNAAAAILLARCRSDVQPATVRLPQDAAAAAATGVEAKTAQDWPVGLRLSTAAASRGERATSSAPAPVRLARYARASLAATRWLLLAGLCGALEHG